MKAILFAAVVFAASAGAALAGEGNGDPFPQHSAGLGTYNTSGPAIRQASRPVPPGARLLPDASNMGQAQTPNSLPLSFAGSAGRSRS